MHPRRITRIFHDHFFQKRLRFKRSVCGRCFSYDDRFYIGISVEHLYECGPEFMKTSIMFEGARGERDHIISASQGTAVRQTEDRIRIWDEVIRVYAFVCNT